MHIPPSYIDTANLGNLRHQPLQHQPVNPRIKDFAKEVNESGAYIHKLYRYSNAIEEQLDKIEENKIPTPGTFVGVGIHRTYNEGRWAGTSGFVFSPETVSLISYKGDIASVRLAYSANRKDFSHFTKGSPEEQYADYAKYLSKEFDTFGPTQSAYNNRKPKQLRLVEDVDFAKAKYRELAIRSNLAFRKRLDRAPGSAQDESSKHMIVKMLKPLNRCHESWTKSSLLAWLATQTTPTNSLTPIIEHAIKKIERFKDDQSVHNYLRRGEISPEKSSHYTGIMEEWGAQTPNEHLLMPTLDNVLGVCVNVETVEGLDQALEINQVLNKRLKSAGRPTDKTPALVYQISHKLNSSVVHIGWSQQVAAWSSDGLKEFAKTGSLTGIDGSIFVPNHFKLISTLANAGGLVFFAPEKKINGVTLSRNFLDDLSSVKDGNSNLLHLAIKNGRDLDCIKFFYYWKVDAFSEKNDAGKTALELAHDTKHSCYSFLSDAKNWNGDELKIASGRNQYISERLALLPVPNTTYSLRNGVTENGTVSYVPELGALHVTEGEFWIDCDKNSLCDGIRKYNEALGDMSLTVGTRTSTDPTTHAVMTTEAGIWSVHDPQISHYQTLYLGTQHNHAIPDGSQLPAMPECIGIVSNVAGCHANMKITLLRHHARYSEVELESSVSTEVVECDPDKDSSSYFKAKFFLPTRAISAIRTGYAFGHLQIIERSIDVSLSQEAKNLIHCKFLLAQIHYLAAWKNNIVELSPIELDYIKKKNPDFASQTKSALIDQRKALHDLLEKHGPSLASELQKIDKKGNSMLNEIGKEYCRSASPDHVRLQTVLAEQFESLNAPTDADMILARELYERAAHHQFSKAELALSRFYRNGTGGLTKDAAKAKELIALAKLHTIAATASGTLPWPVEKPLPQQSKKSLRGIFKKVGAIFD